MKYMLLVCADTSRVESPPAAGEPGPAESPIDAWLDAVRGMRLDGSQLLPPSAAKTVRVRDGETLLGDGPFAETKEVIAGFDILECADLDEAIAMAARHPVAKSGAIEVRPFWPE
ncbi:MAG TPA: YciI family protein [Streptosporangiaceae bacterium]|jgi:hypothetical protein